MFKSYKSQESVKTYLQNYFMLKFLEVTNLYFIDTMTDFCVELL